jgi:D-serine deaminase-like pyridoxal phosphate-dependent protein
VTVFQSSRSFAFQSEGATHASAGIFSTSRSQVAIAMMRAIVISAPRRPSMFRVLQLADASATQLDELICLDSGPRHVGAEDPDRALELALHLAAMGAVLRILAGILVDQYSPGLAERERRCQLLLAIGKAGLEAAYFTSACSFAHFSFLAS